MSVSDFAEVSRGRPEKKLLIVDRWQPGAPRTGEAGKVLLALGAPRALVVDGGGNVNLMKSVRNLPGSDFLAAEGLNVYDILRHETLVLTAESARKLEATLT